jgi:crotonobetainyl-CoA:carnitine CoA-transferase CaiB-like acyl-CoA transferase
MRAPLDGLRVVDLSWGFAGALISLTLADYGAAVVRVEPPDGDVLRTQPAFPLWGRGKQSVVLDLRTAAGRATTRRLAENADVVVATFRPGVADRMGLGWDDLGWQNPGLVYASITGFGATGPYARLKGYEGIVTAKLGGMQHVAGMAPRPGPAFPSVPYAGFGAAHTALQGILAALWVRERTGRGQLVETSLAQGLAAHDPWEWFLRLLCEKYPDAYVPSSPYSDTGVPISGFAFRLLVALTADGRWLQFSQTSPHLFRELIDVLELGWIWDDPVLRAAPDFDTEADRRRFWELMLEAVRRRTAAEWDEVFRTRPNVWAEPFRTTREVMDHPQMRHNGHVLAVDDPVVGPTEQLAPFVRMARTPGAVRSAAPSPGQHTDAVLEGLRRGALHRGSTPPAGTPPRRALDGVTVLELGIWYAAPFGAALLADLGARVVKLEPLSGEPLRHVLPVAEAGAVKVLQGKESVAVDLATPEGQAIAHRLARTADLALVSYRAGAAERLGVDYASLARENPRLVYLNAPGYGVDGPCARKPAYAPTIGVATGVARFQAGPSIPEGPGLSLAEIEAASIRLNWAGQAPGNADGCAALGVATALLLGLVARERTGEGQEMLASMLGTTAWVVSDDAIAYAGRPPRAEPDPMLYGLSALYRLYEASAGWVFLACPQPREWDALCRALVADVDLAADGRFATPAARREHDAALADVLADVFRRRPAAAWEHALVAADVACVEVAPGPVAARVIGDPALRAAGMLADVEHPTFGPHRRLAPLVRLSLTPGEARPACRTGQHTAAVLSELGYGDEAVADLARRGIVTLG